MVKGFLAASSAALLLLGGCSSKSFTDAAVTKPLHMEAQSVSVEYAAAKEQRELYQPVLEAALLGAGVKLQNEAGVSVVVAPLFIGDYMRYNNPDNPIETIRPLSKTEIQEKIAHERDAAAALQKSLYYRFTDTNDYSSVAQWSKTYALSAASAMLTAYIIDGAFDIDGWQMITDVYVDGQRTRVFAHTFDGSLEPNEAVAELAGKTAEQIVRLVAAKGADS